MDIRTFLERAIAEKASDLHIASGNPPMLRIDGKMQPLETNTLGAGDVRSMISAITKPQDLATFDAENDLDFTVDFDAHHRFRVNLFRNKDGEAAVFRAIPTEVLSLEQLNSPPILKELAEMERGLVLVTGPTGSGKSTTLAAMIHHINATMHRHILTIEDPIEFIHAPKQSLINQREVGRNTDSFARALRGALREDPDVILVGEMRDYETIALALTAAETGHLVLGTLHSSSAAKTVDRIIDVFPAGDKAMATAMLAGSLQAVIAQTLLPKADGKGRVAALEILIGTMAIRNLIREGKVPQIYSMMQMGTEFGMQTMEDALALLVEKGEISDAAALEGWDTPTEEGAPQTPKRKASRPAQGQKF